MTAFTEVAARVFVLRHPVLDVNVTLVVGDGAALMVDTLSTPSQARALREAARRITTAPLTVVNTHHHFDHWLGNATIDPVAVYAHPDAAALMTPAEPGRAYAEFGASHPELAELASLDRSVVRPPDRLVSTEAALDLGGRRVLLCYLGRGHTAGDLVVHIPDAGLLVAGDLVEESGPPQFDDGYPLEWPATLAALLALGADVIVPGHGAVCDRMFVRAQHDELAALEWLIREGDAAGAPVEAVAAKAPYPVGTAIVAVARGYAQLSGDEPGA